MTPMRLTAACSLLVLTLPSPVFALRAGLESTVPNEMDAALKKQAPTAAHSAAGLEEGAMIADLMAQLTNAEPSIRVNAAYRLRQAGPSASPAVPALTALLSDPAFYLRAAASRALGAIGPGATPAIPALRNILTDPDYRVRIDAAEALGRIQHDGVDEVTVSALTERLRDSESRVISAAARALGAIGPGAIAAVPALIDTLRTETALSVEITVPRYNTTIALGKIGPGAIRQLYDLQRGRRSAEGMMAAEALETLGQQPDPAIRENLRQARSLVELEEGGQFKNQVVAELRTMRDEAWVRLLDSLASQPGILDELFNDPPATAKKYWAGWGLLIAPEIDWPRSCLLTDFFNAEGAVRRRLQEGGATAGLEEPREFEGIDGPNGFLAALRREQAYGFFEDYPAIVAARKHGARVFDLSVDRLQWRPNAKTIYFPRRWLEPVGAVINTLGWERDNYLTTPVPYEDPAAVTVSSAGVALVVRSAQDAPVPGLPNLVLSQPEDLKHFNFYEAYTFANHPWFNGRPLPPVVGTLSYFDAAGEWRLALFV